MVAWSETATGYIDMVWQAALIHREYGPSSEPFSAPEKTGRLANHN